MTTTGNDSGNNGAANVENIGALTPHNKALYEAGKSLLVDSITTAREFCKSMIGISTGAIPIYLGILSLLFPEHYTLKIPGGIALAVPAVGFLVAAVVFIFGYLPITANFSLDVIEEIQSIRLRIIKQKRTFIIIGVILFAVSTLWAIISIIVNIGVR
jgi:hypothetical protein